MGPLFAPRSYALIDPGKPYLLKRVIRGELQQLYIMFTLKMFIIIPERLNAQILFFGWYSDFLNIVCKANICCLSLLGMLLAQIFWTWNACWKKKEEAILFDHTLLLFQVSKGTRIVSTFPEIVSGRRISQYRPE